MKLLSLFVWVLIGLSVRFVFANENTVNVLEASTVRLGDDIKLGQVAEINIDDPDFRSKIYDLVIYPATTDAKAFEIPSEELALTIRQRLSFSDLKKISVKIPTMVKIKPQKNYLSTADFGHQIITAVQSHCHPCRVKLTELKLPTIPKDEEILRLSLHTSEIKDNNSFVLPLIVESSRGRSNFWVNSKVNVFKKAPVAKRLIRAGELIGENDFDIKEVNTTYAKDGVPTPEFVNTKVANRIIQAGETIYFNDVRKVPDLFRGQVVKILVGTETFEITTTGTAEQDGNIGDRVKVRNDANKKSVTGQVTEKGTVKLE
jgi:flagella basal body P-ring formation protein FlgA